MWRQIIQYMCTDVSKEPSSTVYQTTRRHIAEERIINIQRHGNLKSFAERKDTTECKIQTLWSLWSNPVVFVTI